ncbi:MAG: hypothetical protein J0H40_05450 [Rhizobiales bacterium]|nr:hypothetical protein [Hyphomicrobiales bacterium]
MVQFILMPGSCFLLFCVAANAAPPQALDKTVTVSFTGFTPAVCGNGRHNNRSRTTTQRIYISTKGRLFVEGAAHSAVYSRKRRAPPSQAAFHFSGSKLVGTFASSVSGARREIISFDPSFHGCTAQVIVGEEPGRPFTWISLSGVRCTGTGKTEISNISCSIADGNVFAR